MILVNSKLNGMLGRTRYTTRFNIDNSSRVLHGALLDSEILAEVYLELIGGRQPDFALSAAHEQAATAGDSTEWRANRRPEPLPSRITEEERAAHDAFLDQMGDKALWKKVS